MAPRSRELAAGTVHRQRPTHDLDVANYRGRGLHETLAKLGTRAEITTLCGRLPPERGSPGRPASPHGEEEKDECCARQCANSRNSETQHPPHMVGDRNTTTRRRVPRWREPTWRRTHMKCTALGTPSPPQKKRPNSIKLTAILGPMLKNASPVAKLGPRSARCPKPGVFV
eukprot:11228312-Lingulodinium_polyedra.AAC.3